ncbi:terminase large subunit domain-containing protein [Mobilicoccus caccae]|uniref:Phage terminase large subunit n=1 Tax=Mobilicoccus caccae TaxID=1859295 RepID=A0ABQ6IRW6_9MICO|nr:terminase family protein [Mobilicoccus caccae]GMA40204.1 phage terminase large subunit [Mobilicoccus caccae]
MRVIRSEYEATDKQRDFHSATEPLVLFGGSAGGGKSRSVREEALSFASAVPGSRQLILRRTFPELARSHVQAFRLELPVELGVYAEAAHEVRLRNGSVVELGHLQHEGDVQRYQSAEYARIYADEATQLTQFQLTYMQSRLRVAGPVRDRMAELGLVPAMRMTANPGGVSHAWVKAQFIDPAPPGTTFTPPATLEDPNPAARRFIPARVTDNPHIDASYVDRLNGLDEDTRRALRDGDWDVYAGMAFGEWRREVHVVDPARMPGPDELAAYPRAVGCDYGLSAPFAAVWLARLGDGLLYLYRERYAPELTPHEQAEQIRDAETRAERDRPCPVALDPSTWARNPHHVTRHPGRTIGDLEQGPPPGSIAAAYRDVLGGRVEKADNDRMAGVALLRDKLRVRDDGAPRLVVSSACVETIRTLPSLPRDPRRPELYLSTGVEDHLADALTYGAKVLAAAPATLPEPAGIGRFAEGYGPVIPTATRGIANMRF